eukprot:6183572-Pleurochrysis_carterae.AAC.1
MACCVSDAVSIGMDVTFDASWEGDVELPPFKVDNNFAVEFLRAVIDSAEGTSIKHTFCLTEAVAVQVRQLLLSAKDARAKHAFAPQTGLQAFVHFSHLFTSSSACQRLALTH